MQRTPGFALLTPGQPGGDAVGLRNDPPHSLSLIHLTSGFEESRSGKLICRPGSAPAGATKIQSPVMVALAGAPATGLVALQTPASPAGPSLPGAPGAPVAPVA